MDLASQGQQMYLDLMERILTNTIYRDAPIPLWGGATEYDGELRAQGKDWPSVAHTMVGRARLRNVRECLDRVVADGVAGDFIETGVWRGGVCIFARAYLKVHGIADRLVWVADSFEGMPKAADDGHPLDIEAQFYRANDILGVALETVQENFRRYDLLDDQVRFLKGWFRDTLPTAPVEKLAVLRLDGDLYESTTDALESLYPRLSPGGFVIVDDYEIPACQTAVHDFRDKNRIVDEIERIDAESVYWRRSA